MLSGWNDVGGREHGQPEKANVTAKTGVVVGAAPERIDPIRQPSGQTTIGHDRRRPPRYAIPD
jgi:hypothetical protein